MIYWQDPIRLKPFFNPKYWIWSAIILSVSICVAIAFLHFRQKSLMQQNMLILASLKDARVDLAKGFLYASVDKNDWSAFNREQGLVYIQQSIDDIRNNLKLLQKLQPQNINLAQKEVFNDFEALCSVFVQTLKNQDLNDSDPELQTNLRLIYFNLEKKADAVDNAMTDAIERINNRVNQSYIVVLFVSAILLSAICAFLFFVVKLKSRSDKALVESEQHFRGLFQNMLNGLSYHKIVTENGVPVDVQLLSVNSSFERITNLHHVVGKKISDVVPGIWDRDAELLQIFAEVANTGNSHSCEYYVSSMDMWFSFNLYSSKKGYFVAIFDVINERIKAELLLKQKNEEIEAQNEEYRQINEELKTAKLKAEEIDKLKTAFLCNMSHEIRTPMNAIVGFSDFMASPNTPVEKRQRYAEIIRERSFDLLRIIEDVLDVSKIEVGQMDIVNAEVKVNDMLLGLDEFYKQKSALYDVKSEVQLLLDDENLIPDLTLMSDEQRIKQVLVNFLDNAFKFTRKGTITFGYQIDGNAELVFFVKDTGIGIPTNKLDYIFDRFRQAEEAVTGRQFGGTGLGLSISKGIAKLLGGRIWVESEIGIGSTFLFAVPLSITGEFKTPAAIHSSMPEGDISSELVVLIVEDDEFNNAYIAEILESIGVHYISVFNGFDALSTVQKQNNIGLVLMDIRLPDMSGLDVCKEIKSTHPHIPVVAQTAYAANVDKQVCMNMGCNDYLSKPINQTQLKDIVLYYLHKK